MPGDATTTDPARVLALLWGDRHGSTRKSKHDLSVARIAAAGIALADTSGIEALSMRRVAEKLHVGTMSLYTYVPGKAELIDVMVDTVLASIAQHVDTGGGWRKRLEAVAGTSYNAHLEHPWLLGVSVSRTLLGPGAAAKYEHELSTIDNIGLSDIEMDAVVAVVNGHVAASARRALEQPAGNSDTQQWWQQAAPLLASIADYSRYPLAARVGGATGNAHGAAHPPDGGFSFGLARILDGVTTLVRSRSLLTMDNASDCRGAAMADDEPPTPAMR